MRLTILGSSSATPIYDRHPSSQLLSVNDHLYLIDCGEGTLFRINDFKIKKNKIIAIFISHLHGDHFYGLIGLLTTMSMHERTETLTIVSPARLKDIIQLQCEISKTIIRFPINYVEFSQESKEIYTDSNATVTTIPLEHKIDTCGFLFSKKHADRKVIKSKIEEYKLTNSEIAELIKGNTVQNSEGKSIQMSDISEKNLDTKTFAYCSDTQFSKSYIPLISNIDLLYHESTFLQKDKNRAIDTKHSTASEAAEAARLANVKKLLIGHFSARYLDLEPLLEEAKLVFENTELALEGKTFLI